MPVSPTPHAGAGGHALSPSDDHHNKGCWQRYWYRRYNSSPWQQFHCNWTRQLRATYRNYGLWRDIWLLAIVIGVLVGLLFYQLGVDETGIQERVALFFFILSYIAFNAVQLVPVLAQQRPVYYTNIHAGYMHPFFYFSTFQLVQLPIIALETLLLLTPLYGLAHLAGSPWISSHFWIFYLIVLLNSHIARTWLLCLYVISPNESVADVLNQVTNILFSKLCGFFIAAGIIVTGWKWVFHISWFTYALRAMANNDLVRSTKGEGAGEGRNCFPSTSDSCRFQTGAEGLQLLYQMDTTITVWSDILSLFYFSLAFNFAAYILLCYMDYSSLDQFEAPDWGSATLQMQDAQAYQESVAAEKGLISEKEQRRNTLTRHTSSATLMGKRDGKAKGAQGKSAEAGPPTPKSGNQQRPGSTGAAAAAAAADAEASTNNRPGFLRRVLQNYASRSGSKPKHSHIVVPIATSHLLGPQAVGDRPSSARGAQDAPVVQSQECQPRMRARAASLGEAPSMPEPDEADKTLTRTHRAHYHHEIHEVDVAALLHDDVDEGAEGAEEEAQKKDHLASPAAAGAANKLQLPTAGAKSPSAVGGGGDRLRARSSSRGGAAAKPGAVLEWSNLCYSVPVKDDKGNTIQRLLLDHCYGHVEPGQMTALSQ